MKSTWFCRRGSLVPVGWAAARMGWLGTILLPEDTRTSQRAPAPSFSQDNFPRKKNSKGKAKLCCKGRMRCFWLFKHNYG